VIKAMDKEQNSGDRGLILDETYNSDISSGGTFGQNCSRKLSTSEMVRILEQQNLLPLFIARHGLTSERFVAIFHWFSR